MTKTEAGRLGGIATKEKYGMNYYSEIGKLGGRPTWQQELANAQLKSKLRGQARFKKGVVTLAPESDPSKIFFEVANEHI